MKFYDGETHVKYAFTTYYSGDYKFCVTNTFSSPYRVSVKLNTGIDAKDYTVMA